MASSRKPLTGPETRLHLWPHRSLPRTGFVWFIGITVGLASLPMLAITGSPALWAVLPFAAITIAGVWFALKRSYRDAQGIPHDLCNRAGCAIGFLAGGILLVLVG